MLREPFITPAKVEWGYTSQASTCLAKVNQHPPVHHEEWMISGKETIFYQVPVP